MRALAASALLLGLSSEPRPVEAAEVVGGAGTALRLDVNKGRLIRLERAASTVFIADPEIADVQVKSPMLVYVFARKPGETTLFAVDQNDAVLAHYTVTVTPDIARLERTLRDLYPGTDINVSAVDGTVVLNGLVATAQIAESAQRVAVRFAGAPEAVVTRLGVTKPQQVNLRVRVAEVSRDINKQLGFDWNIAGAIGSLTFGLATANPFAAAALTNRLTSAVGLGSGGLGFRNLDVNVVIDALEDEGMLTILAEPNLTAVSGETASFLAGGEFPILVPDSNGRVTIEFKKFGVSLAFTPTVLGEGTINMRVRPEVSQLSNENAVTLNSFQVPSLITRRAETTVELASGQSFAIAGLLQNNITHDISKLPGLGDVPVLGGLFRSDRFRRDESELVIIVTPYVVQPVSARKLAAPTDGLVAPDDATRFQVGGTYRQTTGRPASSVIGRDGRALIGPVGFETP